MRALSPAIKVLLLTSSGDDEALRAALLAGAKGYAIKLAHSSDLVEAVRRVGDGRSLMDERLVARTAERLREDADTLDPPLTGRESRLLADLLSGATDRQLAERTGEPVETVSADVARAVERLMDRWH